jgi:hypothetical protein
MAEAGSAAVPSAEEAGRWAGYGVDDLDGSPVGQVHGLFLDEASGEPSWLIVRQGRVRGILVAVPLRDCAAAAGRVWVAHGRDAIRTAPVVDPARPLLREHELTICAHFGIGERVGRAAEVASRDAGAITSRPGL